MNGSNGGRGRSDFKIVNNIWFDYGVVVMRTNVTNIQRAIVV